MSWYQRRKMDWLERCGLRDAEEWPLFGVKKFISKTHQQVWVMVTDLPPLHAAGLRMLLQEVRRLERRLEAEGIVGWMQAIRKDNWAMRRWTERIGAELYAETEEHWHFRKQADAAAIPKSLKALVAQQGGYHYGSA